MRMRQAIRNHKARLSQVSYSMGFITKLEEVEKWLLNYARNANNPTPVASAITTKKVNAQRRLASMRLLKQAMNHQRSRMEVRYDPEQVSAPV